MLNKTMVKSALAAALLFSAILGQAGGTSAAATVKPTAVPTAKPSAKPIAKPTAAPVMTDNLAKYGLKKDLDLPVTITSGGLSYTLEKIMIYDINSPEVKQLRKLYGFQDRGIMVTDPKYFIWTKVTLANNTKKKLWGGGIDLQMNILLRFQNGEILDAIWPEFKKDKTNDKEALWTYSLAPGEKITSYLAYAYKGNFDYFALRMFNDGFVEKYVVNQ